MTTKLIFIALLSLLLFGSCSTLTPPLWIQGEWYGMREHPLSKQDISYRIIFQSDEIIMSYNNEEPWEMDSFFRTDKSVNGTYIIEIWYPTSEEPSYTTFIMISDTVIKNVERDMLLYRQ